MNYILVLVFLFCNILNAQYQNNVYHSKILNTEFNIQNDSKIQLLDSKGAETYVILSSNGNFKFNLIITKISNANMTFEDLKQDEYRQSYLKNCNCKITKEQIQEYGSLKTYEFATVMENKENQILGGLVNNAVKGSDVIAVIYLTTLSNYEMFKDDYTEILTSISW